MTSAGRFAPSAFLQTLFASARQRETHMSEKIKAMLEQRVKLVADSRKILEKAEAEKRPLNAAEEENWAKVNADIDGLKDQADRLAAPGKHEGELDVSRGRETRGDDPAKGEPDAKSSEEHTSELQSHLHLQTL